MSTATEWNTFLIEWAKFLKIADFLRSWKRAMRENLERLESSWMVRLLPRSTHTYRYSIQHMLCAPLLQRPTKQWLEENFAKYSSHLNKKLYVVCPVLGSSDEIEGFDLDSKLYVQVKGVKDLESYLSFIAGFKHLILLESSPSENYQKVRTVLERLNILPSTSVTEVFQSIARTDDLVLTGPRSVTYPIFKQLKDLTRSGHYGYKEKLNAELIAELPNLYKSLSQVELTIKPEMSLFQGLGRAARQFGVGRMYGPRYFQGESVLDVGCDIGGVRQFVGPNTRYFGVDMQGLPNQVVNLDRDGLPFGPKEFETVLVFEVLEHLERIHDSFDSILKIAKNTVIGSLYVETASSRGRLCDAGGAGAGNATLPLASVFDRHRWIFNFADALNFVHYRAGLQGYKIESLQLFYEGEKELPRTAKKIERAFRKGDIITLNHNVVLLAFVLRRNNA
jgi:hypothetical protein